MTTITDTVTDLRETAGRRFNWRLFLQDNITGSWYQTLWVAILTLFTAFYTVGRFNESPISTIIVLVVWFVGLMAWAKRGVKLMLNRR